jgi:type I restriction enzyme S subunit
MSTATTHIETDKELVPEIRFEGFDGGIVEYLFNDIFLFSTGKSIKQKEASPEFETPCVRYGELYHMYNEVINEVINKTNLEKSELRFSKGDEILLPSAGEDPLDIGSASALTLKNVAIGRTINILRPMKVDVYSQIFASYYINQKLRKKISTLAKGSSISNVYNSDLKTLKINLPSLPEQQKIASFLAALDDKIQQLTKKKELLEDYKKGVMQQLFCGQLRFKDENGEAYPDWEEKRLGEIGEFKTSSVDKKIVEGETLVKLVNYMNVYRHEEILPDNIDNLMVVSAKTNQLETSDLKKGDVLFTPSSETPDDIGHSVVIFKDLPNTLYSYHLMRFRPSIKLDLMYSHFFCNTADVLRQISRFATGSTRFTISVGNFSAIKLSIPCFEEQQKIATYLSSIDTKIESVNNQITQTQTFKKGLLQQMFV